MNNKFLNYYNTLREKHPIPLILFYIVIGIVCELLFFNHRALIRIIYCPLIVFLIVNIREKLSVSLICGIIAFFLNIFFFIIFVDAEVYNYYIVSGKITGKTHNNGYNSSRKVYYTYCLDGKRYKYKRYDSVTKDVFDQVEVGDMILIRLNEQLEVSTFIQDSACVNYYTTGRYFSKPVKYVNKQEFGNDYYYYAKLNPTLAFKNFGLNRVFMGLGKNDSLLVYKNINDSIEFKTVHICADTLQTAANRALVGDTFAFLFHDGIYTKEQVFEEIPEAKEYYYKYYKESE